MARDRFLLSILIGIGVLILAALILFFIRQGKGTYGDESTPAGVLQNYFLAVQKRDFQRAYSYLADSSQKPDLVHFQQFLVGNQGSEINSAAVEVGAATLDSAGQTAVIQVYVVHNNRDIFSGSYTSQEAATLVRQNSAWKISQAPYPYWGYDWEYKAIPPAPTLTPAPTATP